MLPIEIEQRLEDIKRILQKHGAELIDISLRKSSGRSVLTVVADKTGGITLDDCAGINRSLGDYFDNGGSEGEGPQPVQEPFLEGSYFLEVNSPGLDRPLKSPRDYERAIGEVLCVVYSDEFAARTLIGKLISINDGVIEMTAIKQGTQFMLPLHKIIKAVREISFK